MWGPGMYMKMALVPKGIRAIHLSYGAGDGKSKGLLRKPLFRCGPLALACCAGKCSRIFSASHPAGFDSRRPARLRKRLWSQKEPEPFIYLMERATGIEPASSAWKAGVLPLNYARKIWSGRQDLTCDILLPKQARYQTAPRPEGVEQLRSKPCVSQSEGNYRGDSPPVQAQKH